MNSTSTSGPDGRRPDRPAGREHVKDNSQRLPADADEVTAARRLAEAERAVAAGGGTAEDRAALARVDSERAPDKRLAEWRAADGPSERSDQVEQTASRRLR